MRKVRREASGLPMYMQVANDIVSRIGAEVYQVGSLLPKEMELTAQYDVSRHTVREALRRVRDAGLISRRKRAGTAVVSRHPITVYKQPINSIQDILQYAENTQVRTLRKGCIRCNSALAALLESKKGREWFRVVVLRIPPDSQRPICLANTYLNLELPHIDAKFEDLRGPISAMLEALYDLRITRINQTIESVLLNKRDARLLQAEPSSPALKTIRKYFDENGRMIEVSVALHPGDRFSYITRLELE